MAFNSALSEESVNIRGIESPAGKLGRADFSLDDASGLGPFQPEWEEPVENSMAPRASLSWHRATVAPHAALAQNAAMAQRATVRGELRVPNTINFRLFPTLDPFAKAVYYELFLLSHGFRRDTCVISLGKLSQRILISPRKVQNTITYLERRGLVRRLQPVLGGASKGIVYHVLVPDADSASNTSMAGSATVAPHATLARDATVAPRANNKYDDDEETINNHHQRGTQHLAVVTGDGNHSGAAAPRERETNQESDFDRIRIAYERFTGNRWRQSDTAAYEENGIGTIAIAKTLSVLETVSRRTPTKINSFRYFVQEILATPDSKNRARQKKQLEKIVARIRYSSVGRGDYSSIDFLDDVKCACVREGIVFNDDLYNELVE
jgi:hypothetical protein